MHNPMSSHIAWLKFFQQCFVFILIIALTPLFPLLIAWALIKDDNIGLLIENLSYKFTDLRHGIKLIWRMVIDTVKFFAWVTIIIFVAISVLVLSNLVLQVFDVNLIWFAPYHAKLTMLLKEEAAWAALTIIIGSMAVINNHFRLELEQFRFKNEVAAQQRQKLKRNTVVTKKATRPG